MKIIFKPFPIVLKKYSIPRLKKCEVLNKET